ncbi:hypothetical protein Q3C19_12180 [Bacteroides sp. ET489]|uniref:hypothetical protein n=1 Tax=Bacteroides TaxID=816 RepID=UPI001C375A90|nr:MULTISPECIES: hypothetical protein [Bacteroides]MBV3450522.1 hypothetical protein [Bacteroides xylanisolvens]MDO3391226.1 hypothetical protein [Bacteroides sp. ET489]
MAVCVISRLTGCPVLQPPGCRYGWMSGWLVSRLSQRCNGGAGYRRNYPPGKVAPLWHNVAGRGVVLQTAPLPTFAA